MRKLIISAAAVAAVLAGSSAAMAECSLPNNNWSCEVETKTDTILSYERNGNSHMCKVYESTVTTTTYTAINPGNQPNPQHDGEPEVSDPSDPVKLGGNVVCPDGTP